MRLILLHGWGASGDDLLPLGEELQRALGWPAQLQLQMHVRAILSCTLMMSSAGI